MKNLNLSILHWVKLLIKGCKDDQKEVLFKRLEDIKGKNEEQLQAIKDQGKKQLKELKNIDKNKTLKAIDKISKKNDEANKLLSEFKKINDTLDNAELVCTKTDGTKYDFNCFSLPLKFVEKIYKNEITLDEAIEKQAESKELLNKLNNYSPRISKKIEVKNRVSKSAKKLFDARDDIIDLFEKGIFPYKDNAFKTKKEESEENKFQKIKDDYKKFMSILKMNKMPLPMTCLKMILVFQYLELWQNNYMKYKIKRKTMSW